MERSVLSFWLCLVTSLGVVMLLFGMGFDISWMKWVGLIITISPITLLTIYIHKEKEKPLDLHAMSMVNAGYTAL